MVHVLMILLVYVYICGGAQTENAEWFVTVETSK